jgi:hypothetical protein
MSGWYRFDWTNKYFKHNIGAAAWLSWLPCQSFVLWGGRSKLGSNENHFWNKLLCRCCLKSWSPVPLTPSLLWAESTMKDQHVKVGMCVSCSLSFWGYINFNHQPQLKYQFSTQHTSWMNTGQHATLLRTGCFITRTQTETNCRDELDAKQTSHSWY